MKKWVKWTFRCLTLILAIILLIYASWLILNDLGLFIYAVVVIGVTLAFILGGVILFLDWVWSDD